LRVLSTHDADDTLTQAEMTPILVCDLFGHAYCLDHRNDRKGCLEAWFGALRDWKFAASQHTAAQGRAEPWRQQAPVAAAKSSNASAA
jgi:Fe-Mn family superoxide dismutase